MPPAQRSRAPPFHPAPARWGHVPAMRDSSWSEHGGASGKGMERCIEEEEEAEEAMH